MEKITFFKFLTAGVKNKLVIAAGLFFIGLSIYFFVQEDLIGAIPSLACGVIVSALNVIMSYVTWKKNL